METEKGRRGGGKDCAASCADAHPGVVAPWEKLSGCWTRCDYRSLRQLTAIDGRLQKTHIGVYHPKLATRGDLMAEPYYSTRKSGWTVGHTRAKEILLMPILARQDSGNC